MQTDKSIPYPRPDYTDRDLLTKELINGTFSEAIIGEAKSFRPPLGRYNVTEEKLTDMSLLKGDITPQAYDIQMRDMSLDGAKELGWLPAKRQTDKPEPEVIYDPLKHYVFVEWVGINSTDLQADIPSHNTATYNVDKPYYDDDNAGLFGFKTLKDSDGNVTDVYAAFYSLRDLTMTILGRLPDGLDLRDSLYVGYVKGAFILRFHGGTYVSFTLNGEVFVAGGYTDYYTPLGDEGNIAIETQGGNTAILDTRLEVLQLIDGGYCRRAGGFATGTTKYPFGTKIRGTYYFLRDDSSSYRFRRTKAGWAASVIESEIWKFTKRLKYDYATDNWLQTPLKTLKYNVIVHGIYVQNRFPLRSRAKETSFINSDMHGDFAKVGDAYYHTYDFRKWEEVTGDAATHLYGCVGRMWTKGRQDGVSGLMPYTIAVKSVNDLQGGKKTVLQYSGFIFRGGT